MTNSNAVSTLSNVSCNENSNANSRPRSYRAVTDNSPIVYVYSLKGSYLYTTTEMNYAHTAKVPLATLKAALVGFRGYGYCGDKFVSSNPVKSFWSAADIIGALNSWCLKNLTAQRAKLRAMYKAKYCEDCVSDTLAYMVRAANSDKGINAFEPVFIGKYKMCYLETLRRKTTPDVLFDDVSDTTLISDGIAVAHAGSLTETPYDEEADYTNDRRMAGIEAILKRTEYSQVVATFLSACENATFGKDGNIHFNWSTLVRRTNSPLLALIKKSVARTAYNPNGLCATAWLKEVVERCWLTVLANKQELEDMLEEPLAF